MSHRPLALVCGLTLGDYLLWNWSLSGGHDVLALISGLSLPPIVVACVWLLALSGARLLARSARSTPRAPRRAGGFAASGDYRPDYMEEEQSTAPATASSVPPSRKLAA